MYPSAEDRAVHKMAPGGGGTAVGRANGANECKESESVSHERAEAGGSASVVLL